MVLVLVPGEDLCKKRSSPLRWIQNIQEVGAGGELASLIKPDVNLSNHPDPDSQLRCVGLSSLLNWLVHITAHSPTAFALGPLRLDGPFITTKPQFASVHRIRYSRLRLLA